MLKIRLARVGKKKKPTYRFVVSESARDMYGRSLEILGHYNPFSKVIEVNKERILYWISKGAQVSPTVHNLLVDQNVISGDKVRASKGKKKGKKGEEEGKSEIRPASAKASTDKQDKEVKQDSVEEKSAEGESKPAEEPKKEEPKVEEKKKDKPAEESKKEEPKAEEKKEETKKEEKSAEDKKE